MKMKMKPNFFWSLGSTVILTIGFLLFRYVFFDLHGMSQWTFILFVLGLIIIIAASIFSAKRILICTPLGYAIGFVLGMLFNTDSFDPGGGLLNNAWEIWTISFIMIVLASMAWELLHRKKQL